MMLIIGPNNCDLRMTEEDRLVKPGHIAFATVSCRVWRWVMMAGNGDPLPQVFKLWASEQKLPRCQLAGIRTKIPSRKSGNVRRVSKNNALSKNCGHAVAFEKCKIFQQTQKTTKRKAVPQRGFK